MTDVKTAYPDRYYAAYDTTAPQPTPVTGWYDTGSMSSLAAVPPAASLIPLSAADWANTISFRLPSGRGVLNGKIIDYTAPVPPVPLATQAQNALVVARQAVWGNYGALNEPTPEAWVTYLKALRAIAEGQDSTSTTLPEAPA
ncbi:hypothetical protein [Acetobacter phage phiAO1]|uniref:Uncharacterized protein n=1 Tax=Acetobacter cerevisiae TaxID=178900 RepID=A0A149VDE8_9PROT|nr:hypothetical protein [Acetobacter cerevisiae]KXV78174.1 hypothetical protein AD954_03865 [Acetobacter cerevisiae]BCZ75790.1 hypothetical protein [Acetobacter phage phiAO1]